MTQPQPLDLDAIEQRANEATDGPWWNDDHEIYWGQPSDTDQWIGETCDPNRPLRSRADAAFIAAARTDVPAMVAEVRRLRAERDFWRDRYRQESHTTWDNSLPPGGECCADCGQPVESEPCDEHHPGTVADRLRAELVKALAVLDDGPQWLNDRVQQHWSVPARSAAEILRDALNDALDHCDDREPCGEGHCRCDHYGEQHGPCGCDCPRDIDGQLIHEG